jgi:hypothetical protein
MPARILPPNNWNDGGIIRRLPSLEHTAYMSFKYGFYEATADHLLIPQPPRPNEYSGVRNPYSQTSTSGIECINLNGPGPSYGGPWYSLNIPLATNEMISAFRLDESLHVLAVVIMCVYYTISFESTLTWDRAHRPVENTFGASLRLLNFPACTPFFLWGALQIEGLINPHPTGSTTELWPKVDLSIFGYYIGILIKGNPAHMYVYDWRSPLLIMVGTAPLVCINFVDIPSIHYSISSTRPTTPFPSFALLPSPSQIQIQIVLISGRPLHFARGRCGLLRGLKSSEPIISDVYLQGAA